MSVIKDLLLLDKDGSKETSLEKYLRKKLKKFEASEEEKKKKDKDKKGWSFEDRVCLGLLMAFLAIPCALAYRLMWHILQAG